MSVRSFLDTNIFIYSFADDEPAKQSNARQLIARGLREGNAIISFQVIQEFLNVALHKFAAPLTAEDCRDYLEAVLSPLCQVNPDPDFYRKGLEIHRITGFSFFDSLILAAAIRGGCSRLLTEDMQEGREIEGVRIVNPFS